MSKVTRNPLTMAFERTEGAYFSASDMPVIGRALHSYLIDCLRTEGYSEREPHPDVVQVTNLLQRIGKNSS